MAFPEGFVSSEMPSDEGGTWKTVTVLGTIPLKFDRLSESNLPPKICIPSRAAMKMESMRRTRRAAMLAIEFTKDFTRFPMLSQYLLVIVYWEEIWWKSLHTFYQLPLGVEFNVDKCNRKDWQWVSQWMQIMVGKYKMKLNFFPTVNVYRKIPTKSTE